MLSRKAQCLYVAEIFQKSADIRAVKLKLNRTGEWSNLKEKMKDS